MWRQRLNNASCSEQHKAAVTVVGDGAIALLLHGTHFVLSQYSHLRKDIGSIWRKVTDQQPCTTRHCICRATHSSDSSPSTIFHLDTLPPRIPASIAHHGSSARLGLLPRVRERMVPRRGRPDMSRLPLRLYRDRKPRASLEHPPPTPLADSHIRSRHNMTLDRPMPNTKTRRILSTTTIHGQTLPSMHLIPMRATFPPSNTARTLKAAFP